MTRFKFLFAGLLGLGVKVMAQQTTTVKLENVLTSGQWPNCKSLQAQFGYENGKYICVNDADPAKGEEYCPLGHAQKPELHQLSEWLFGEAIALSPQPVFLHICTVCRMVYSPKQKESVTF